MKTATLFLLALLLVACSTSNEAADDGPAADHGADLGADTPSPDAGDQIVQDATPDSLPEPEPWVKKFGDSYSDLAMAVVSDSAGVLLGGMYNGVIDFGDGALTESTPGSGFVAALDDMAKLQWAISLGDGSDVKAVASCPDGDRIVAGTYKSTLVWGDETLSAVAGTDLFVARVAPDQTLRWLKALSGAGSVDIGGVACAFNDRVIVAGSFLETADLGSGPETAKGKRDAFVTCFDKAGVSKWTQTFGGVEFDAAAAVAVDGAGGIVLVGKFAAELQLGNDLLIAADRSDIFVAALAMTDGTPQWARRYGEGSIDEATDVAVDSGGRIYLTGWFSQRVLFDGKPHDSSGDTDVVIAALEKDGTERWAHGIGAAKYDRGRSIAVDAQGRPVLGATFTATVKVGNTSLTSGGQGAMLVAYDVDGNVRWAHGLSTTQNDRFTVDGITIHNNTGYLTGNIRGKGNLGLATIQSDGAFYDLWLMRFGLSGNGLDAGQ